MFMFHLLQVVFPVMPVFGIRRINPLAINLAFGDGHAALTGRNDICKETTDDGNAVCNFKQ